MSNRRASKSFIENPAALKKILKSGRTNASKRALKIIMKGKAGQSFNNSIDSSYN
jgi:hypothetical protein